MNNDEFVTYEQAVKLKECGFNWCGDYYYVNEEFSVGNNPFSFEAYTTGSIISYAYVDDDNCDKVIPCITLSQAAKWLREVKGLFIEIWLYASGYSWVIEKCGSPNYNGTFVTIHDGDSGDDEDSGLFTTYEKALSDAINKALELKQEI